MQTSSHTSAFVQLVTVAKQHIKETNVPTIKQRLDANENFHLVDVREDNEWSKSHIPQAIHISKGVIERDIEKKIPDKNAEIVLYCGGGYRSALAALSLQQMGYTNVYSMDGGWKGWQAFVG